MKSMHRNPSGERADQHDRKWMIVVALVVGIMIGSLMNKPFDTEARHIEIVSEHGKCFAIFKGSITFFGRGSSTLGCKAN